jgi:hypothetical protein
MKAILLAISCFLALPLMAQDAPGSRAPRLREIPGSFIASNDTAQTPREVEALKDNVTIRLQGTTNTSHEIDLSLSGNGPMFTADQVIDDEHILSCEYVVSETETGYKVSYTVSTRIKVATQTGPDTTKYEYMSVRISGAVLCSADRPQVLIRNGSKPLHLTITKEAEQDGGGQPATRPASK